MGRQKSPAKKAARYQSRLSYLRASVANEVGRGDLRAALRMVLGFAEDVAMDSEQARDVEKLMYARGHLSPGQHDKLRAAWQVVVLDALGEIGLFRTGRV